MIGAEFHAALLGRHCVNDRCRAGSDAAVPLIASSRELRLRGNIMLRTYTPLRESPPEIAALPAVPPVTRRRIMQYCAALFFQGAVAAFCRARDCPESVR